MIIVHVLSYHAIFFISCRLLHHFFLDHHLKSIDHQPGLSRRLFTGAAQHACLAAKEKRLVLVWPLCLCYDYQAVYFSPHFSRGTLTRPQGDAPSWLLFSGVQKVRITSDRNCSAVPTSSPWVERMSFSQPEKRPPHPASLQDCHDILRNAPIGIFISTAEGRFVDANQALANLYGYASAEELMAAITDIASQTYVDRIDRQAFITQLERHGELLSHECRQRRRDGSIFWAEESARALRDSTGQITHYQGFTTDITERKEAEAAREKRMLALVQPLAEMGDITLDELFAMEDLQRLQDEFAEATGVASIITTTDGVPITRPSNFCRLCADIIRATKTGRANCCHSDAVIGKACGDQPTIQPCLSGGLWDAGAAISVGGRHIANWLIGQVRDETQSVAKIRAYAKEIGADPDLAAAAFAEVPAMSRNRFAAIARMVHTLASQLSTMAYQNIRQARFIAERRRADEALLQSETKLASYANQMEQFSLSAASMISLQDEKTIFARISQAIVEYSDFQRVLISLFKEEAPYRDIIGHGGVSQELVDRLAKIPMPKSWYDHVFAQGLHLGQFSYYIPHTMKHILNQDATVYGAGPPGEGSQAWHPEDNLFVRLSDDKGELIGVISVDDAKSGRRPSHETVRPLEIYASLITQIIILKREQANRERLEKQLGMAQKMESVGRLAGGVAHDFNNMLSVILGYTEMALEEVEDEQPLRLSLLGIRQAAERSADLTRQLLAFARKQTIAPRILDCNMVLTGMLTMLRRLIGEDIDLVWLPGNDLGHIKMDPSQIDQILANLCVNARDAIGGHTGKVTIETSNFTVDETFQQIHPGAIAGEYILLAVSDNGAGMNADTLSHLFEPFFTTKEMGKGTGLGLATAYGIVKQNGGFISVYSETDLGTTFKIYLPRHFTAEEAQPAAEPATQPGKANETILLVEDEPMILAMTDSMLRRQGYKVLTATGPLQAIQLASEFSGQIHLLMTDVVMPGMNGKALATRLRLIMPKLKCLFMSGYTANVIARHGVLDEGVNFIQKPFSKKDLAVKIRKVLDQDC